MAGEESRVWPHVIMRPLKSRYSILEFWDEGKCEQKRAAGRSNAKIVAMVSLMKAVRGLSRPILLQAANGPYRLH